MKRLIYLIPVLWVSFACATLAASNRTPSDSTNASPQPTKRLSYENAIKFFKETLKERPLKVHHRCAVFFEGEYTSSNIYSHSVIILENSDEDLEITFYISDDRGMFWISEFIESGFFNRRETESLFALLHGTGDNRRTRVGRYRVELTRAEPHHAKIVVFSFTRARTSG